MRLPTQGGDRLHANFCKVNLRINVPTIPLAQYHGCGAVGGSGILCIRWMGEYLPRHSTLALLWAEVLESPFTDKG